MSGALEACCGHFLAGPRPDTGEGSEVTRIDVGGTKAEAIAVVYPGSLFGFGSRRV